VKRSSTTYTECIFVFPLQQWLRERATLLRLTCIACLDPASCYVSRSFHTPRVNHLSKVHIMELPGLKFSPFSFCPLLFDIQQIFPLFKAFTPAMSATQPSVQWIQEAFLRDKTV